MAMASRQPAAAVSAQPSASAWKRPLATASSEPRRHRQVAPVAPGDDLAADDDDEGRRQGEVENGGHPRPDDGGTGDADAPQYPQQGEEGERQAVERRPAGPARHRR